jgi:hypothetical protein
MYRRKAGRVMEVEDDPGHEDDEDSDPELVRALDDDLEVVLHRPVASTPLVNKGKGRAFDGGTARTAANRKPGLSKRGTVDVRAPRKGGRTMPPSQVEEESELEDFSALLDAVGAISTDEDGVPHFPSSSHLPQSSTKPAMSKGRSRASVKTRGAGRGRGFATMSRLRVARAQEIFDSDELEDFTRELNEVSDTSVERSG